MTILELPTEENLTALITKLPEGITALERILLSSFGTVQTLLSVIFRTPVRVEVLSQCERYGVIIRWVKLLAGENVVCLAESVIPLMENTPGFIDAIRDAQLGIGQAIARLSLESQRELLGFYVDENMVARNYRISGDVEVIITETFPRKTLLEAGAKQ